MADKYDTDDYVSDLEKRIQAKAAPIQDVPQAALQSLQNKIQGNTTNQPGAPLANQQNQMQQHTYPDKYDQVRKQAVLEAAQNLRQQSQKAQQQAPQPQQPMQQQLPSAPMQQEEPETNESPEVSNAKAAIARGNYGNPYEFQKLQQIISGGAGQKDDEQ